MRLSDIHSNSPSDASPFLSLPVRTNLKCSASLISTHFDAVPHSHGPQPQGRRRQDTHHLAASVCVPRTWSAGPPDRHRHPGESQQLIHTPNVGVEILLHPGSDRNSIPLIRKTQFSHIDIITSGPAVAPFDLSSQIEWEKSDLQRCFIDPAQGVINGERRYLAAKQAGLMEIPCWEQKPEGNVHLSETRPRLSSYLRNRPYRELPRTGKNSVSGTRRAWAIRRRLRIATLRSPRSTEPMNVRCSPDASAN